CLICLGVASVMATIGVFVRDIAQVMAIGVSGLMFLSPLFFPIEALPAAVRPWIYLNPVTIPIEQMREILIWGRSPNWNLFAAYSVIAFLVCVGGFAVFNAGRRMFADF